MLAELSLLNEKKFLLRGKSLRWGGINYLVRRDELLC